MDNDEQRDYEEEKYNRDLCPECDYSPCHCPERITMKEEDKERIQMILMEFGAASANMATNIDSFDTWHALLEQANALESELVDILDKY